MSSKILVVLNTGPKDVGLAVEALRASTRLCGQLEARLIIASSVNATADHLADAANDAFTTVEEWIYSEWSGSKSWPAPQNNAWNQVARRLSVGGKGVYAGWFWWEPDSCPLRAGWLETLEKQYTSCAKVFAGFESSHDNQPYMNGVGIYPMDCVNHLQECSALYTYTQPFDIAAGRCVMKSFKRLNGILLHEKKIAGGGKGRSFTAKTVEELLHRNPSAVFYHGCTDSTLQQIIVGDTASVCAAHVKRRPTFYHSGDLGDIIYSLPLIKSLGGGHLLLGPYIPSTLRTYRTRAQLDRKQFDWFAPLLRCQDYLDSVEFTDSDPNADYDLNLFRTTWFNKQKKSKTLLDCYFEHFDAGQWDHKDRWLTVPPKSSSNLVVIHRSQRYRNAGFPWREVIGRYPNAVLVGTKEERDGFQREFGSKLSEFEMIHDALELANNLSGARLFIGNQSLPCAIALGLGVRVLQETYAASADCLLKRSENNYFGYNQIILEPIPSIYVSRQHTDSSNDQILLGPCNNAYGLGDMLTVTPVAKQLGNRCRLQLPHKLAHYGELFRGICDVQLVEDFPVWPGNSQHEHQASYKLRLMGLNTSDNLPLVRLSADEVKQGIAERRSHGAAVSMAAVAFCPTCAPQWPNRMQQDISYWEVFFAGETRRILQFGRTDYPLLKGAVRMPFYCLRELASVYAAIGSYVGVDTGDLHLMLAVGGRTFAVCPDEDHYYNHKEWHYTDKRAVYSSFDAGPKDYQRWRTTL